MRIPRGTLIVAVMTMMLAVVTVPRAQSRDPLGVATADLDQLLDTFVRDGRVRYRAMKPERPVLDRFVASLADVSLNDASRPAQIAFWLNAYNAIVMKTVLDRYPLATRTDNVPGHSIRQIPGVFDGMRHKVAGRTLTLDQIEQTVLLPFHDPRVFLALGRGAAGSGRLRSEAFTEENLDRQLVDVAAECANRAQCLRVDRAGNRVLISAIFSWRQKEFIAWYADHAAPVFAKRAPLERAVLAFVNPTLYPPEQEFLRGNTFRVETLPFDWTLNER